MAISELTGPLVVFSDGGTSTFGDQDSGPSLFWAGAGILDSRFGQNLGQNGLRYLGWSGDSQIPLIDIVPSTLSTTAIAAAQTPTAGTKLNLVSSSGAGITVLATAQTLYPSRSYLPAGTLAIDGAMGINTYGPSGAVGLYDPTKSLARNIQIASVGNDTTATFLVSGYDIYGYPMTERITGANAATAVGKKAFKYVSSVVPAGTLSGSNVSVGQGDTYGYPLLLPTFAYTDIIWAGSWITSSATGTFTNPDVTNPATSLTGDVRGTYKPASASNGTNRLTMFGTLAPGNLGTVAGIYGVTQA